MPFVGRVADLDAIGARFDEGARLVTLLGPGGIGKTALAVEHAARLEGGESVFVDLVAARDAAGIVDAVTVALGAAGDGGVSTALASRCDVLVVLDNFDGLAAFAMETVGTWLEAAPEARLLVTSRERLGLVAEVVLEIGALDAATELLAAAARRGASSFALRGQDVAYAAEIARVVEGVPLALELAGTRLPLLGARALLEALRGASAPLVREARGGPDRHASLDAAVRSSFEALAPHEKDVLAQLTVFRGGFTAESVAGIVDAGAGAVPIAIVGALAARSLVRTRDAGAARFDLYDAVRSFVVREHPGPIAAAAERHARWFVDRAERAASEAHAAGEARGWLVDERDNVLAVVSRVLGASPATAREAEPALRALVASSSVLLARGPLAQIAGIVSPVVERTRDSGADPRLSARAMILRGALRREAGDVRAALRDLLAAESVGRAIGDELLVADAGVELGRTVLAGGEVAAARDHFEKAGRAFASLGARPREALALTWRGVATGAGGDAREARALLERAASLGAADRTLRPLVLATLGRACADAGDPSAAKRALADAARESADDADARLEGEALAMLGLVLHDGGDLEGAAAALARARDVFAIAGLDADAAIVRGHLGVLAREEGRAAEAYALLADGRDGAKRGERASAAAYLEIDLGALDRDVAAIDAAAAAGGRPGVGEPWPIAVFEVAAAARDALAGATETSGSLHARVARRAIGGAATAVRPPDDALVVGAGGTWFRAPGGSRVGLERRRSLALLVDRLAALRTERPGATIGSAALFAAAWPGEKALASAAGHRVRVAVATLRKMGLRDAIVTQADGYALAADVPLVRG